MTYYTVHYGSWRKGDMVTRVCRTTNRKEAFQAAAWTAASERREVTIIAERPTGRGLDVSVYSVSPEGEITED